MKTTTVLLVLAALYIVTRKPAPALPTAPVTPSNYTADGTGLPYRNTNAETISNIGVALSGLTTAIAGFWKD